MQNHAVISRDCVTPLLFSFSLKRAKINDKNLYALCYVSLFYILMFVYTLSVSVNALQLQLLQMGMSKCGFCNNFLNSQFWFWFQEAFIVNSLRQGHHHKKGHQNTAYDYKNLFGYNQTTVDTGNGSRTVYISLLNSESVYDWVFDIFEIIFSFERP